MPFGMGATNPKFAKSVRKPKKVKHCTIPKWRQAKEIFPSGITSKKKRGHTVSELKQSKICSKHEVWGSSLKKLQERKGRGEIHGNLNLKIPSIIPITQA